MTIHERAFAMVQALRTQCGGVLPPDTDQLVRFYAGARALYDRAAHHLVRSLREEGTR